MRLTRRQLRKLINEEVFKADNRKIIRESSGWNMLSAPEDLKDFAVEVFKAVYDSTGVKPDRYYNVVERRNDKTVKLDRIEVGDERSMTVNVRISSLDDNSYKVSDELKKLGYGVKTVPLFDKNQLILTVSEFDY